VRLATDQGRARQTLEALRAGIVPLQDVETLTIGLEVEQVRLQRALETAQERAGEVQAIIGDYGYGKSHVIDLVAHRASRANFLVAQASLDLVEVPPGRPAAIYQALMRSLRYPDTSERGLGPLLRQAAAQPTVVAQLQTLAPCGERCPLRQAVQALSQTTSQRLADELNGWLSGQLQPSAALRQVVRQPAVLYRSGAVARQISYLLSGVSYLARLVGYAGLAVLLDESEHYSLLRASQRERADAFFMAMIAAALGAESLVDPTTIAEHPRAAYPVAYAAESHLFFLFALTESEHRLPIDRWLRPLQQLRLDDRFIERDIATFLATLLHYHAIAYGYPLPLVESWQALLTALAPALLARAIGQHRITVRELIRIAVTLCDLRLLYPADAPALRLAELRHGLHLA
jgi:hypothetical protein